MITEAAFVPPRTIDSHEAARRLMKTQHLVIIGSAAIAEHLNFKDALCRAIPGRIAALRVQIDYLPGAPRLVLSNARPGTAPEYDLTFVPNDLAGRLALSVLLLSAGGPLALAELNRKERELAEDGTPPVLMLESPGGDSAAHPTLERDCVMAVEFLEALHRGRVVDAIRN